MNKFVHQDHKTKEIIRYIDSLIVVDNVKSISDLTYSNKCILSGMLLKSESVTEILNFISQNDNDEKFQDLVSLSLLHDRDKDYKEMTSDYLIGFAVDYYEPMIESILNERLDELSIF